MPSPFHLAIHVHDLSLARDFYGRLLGCAEGRSSATWVDFDFFGHQLSLHLGTPLASSLSAEVAGVAVPMPHFGAVLPIADWQALVTRLHQAQANFLLPPQDRYPDQPGAQATFFIVDPSGNALEFKGFSNFDQVFAKQ